MRYFPLIAVLLLSSTAALADSVSSTSANGVTTVKIQTKATAVCTMTEAVVGAVKTVTVKCE